MLAQAILLNHTCTYCYNLRKKIPDKSYGNKHNNVYGNKHDNVYCKQGPYNSYETFLYTTPQEHTCNKFKCRTTT
jgi:hypothetical protein